MKATTLLERHHRNLQQLCEAVERGSASMRESLLPQLAGDLMAHLAVEAKLFYPAIIDIMGEDAPAIHNRMRHRHQRAVWAIDEALDASVDGEPFESAIRELKFVIELHAQEEEETLFPRIERALQPDASRELGRAMLHLYHCQVEVGYARSRPSSETVDHGHGAASIP